MEQFPIFGIKYKHLNYLETLDMRKTLIVVTIILSLSAFASAQKLPKPKQMPGSLSDQQEKAVQEGVVLHDAKKYDEAIAKFESVLKETPDATLPLYELGLSQYSKGDCKRSKETALRGAQYISDQLPLFYGLIANCLDDEGKSEAAIKLYRDAEDILKSYPSLRNHLSSIYYNLGVTFVRLKKYNDARTELKRAVEADFGYASPHYLLSQVYSATKYKIPAFLAAARLISLDFRSQRTANSAALLAGVLKPAAKNPKTGNIEINLDFGAPTDEGDFGMFDLLLGTLTTVRGDDDKNKSDNQLFVDAIGTVIALLTEDKKLGSTFVGKTYIPFMVEMKKKGHVEAFGTMVIYISNRHNAEAEKWINQNDGKLSAFLSWAKDYQR